MRIPAVALFVFSVALLVLPATAVGQDLTGRWTTTVDWKDGNGDNHSEFPSFEIKKSGDALTANSLRRDGTAGAELKINAAGAKVHLYRFLTLDDGEHLLWKLELQDGKLVGTYSALHDRPAKWIYDRELDVAFVRGE